VQFAQIMRDQLTCSGIYESFGTDGAWGTWIGRWTAEEGRHGIAIRDY
jgi:Fatty acid desaturase